MDNQSGHSPSWGGSGNMNICCRPHEAASATTTVTLEASYKTRGIGRSSDCVGLVCRFLLSVTEAVQVLFYTWLC